MLVGQQFLPNYCKLKLLSSKYLFLYSCICNPNSLTRRQKSKPCDDRNKHPKGLLVVDNHVLFAVISFEPGLCCCLPSDSSRSADILLLFVHGKAVHFPCIKSAFTHVCQDVFGAYLQLLSRSESRARSQKQRGGGKGCFVPKAFFFIIYLYF